MWLQLNRWCWIYFKRLNKTLHIQYFFFNPETDANFQLAKNRYADLANGNFKITETGIVTKNDTLNRRGFLSKYRYKQEDYNGSLLKRDTTFSTKVITDDCSIYYIQGSTTKKSIINSFAKTNGETLTDSDVKDIFGSASFVELDLEANISYDKFTKTYKVATKPHKKMILRGSINSKNQNVSFIQLYADIIFLEKWGFLENAIDTNSEQHEVTKIATNTDCSSRVIGCVLTETIAISLDRTFLETNKNGFEIKAYGTSERVLKVPAELVKAFLNGLDDALKKSKDANKPVT